MTLWVKHTKAERIALLQRAEESSILTNWRWKRIAG